MLALRALEYAWRRLEESRVTAADMPIRHAQQRLASASTAYASDTAAAAMLRDADERAWSAYVRRGVRTIVWAACAYAGVNACTALLAPRVLGAAYTSLSAYERMEFRARVAAAVQATYSAARGVRLVFRWLRGDDVGEEHRHTGCCAVGYWVYDGVHSVLMGGKAEILAHHVVFSLGTLLSIFRPSQVQYYIGAYPPLITDAIIHLVWLLRKAGLAARLPALAWNALLCSEIGSHVALRMIFYYALVLHFMLRAERAATPEYVSKWVAGIAWMAFNAKWFGDVWRTARSMMR